MSNNAGGRMSELLAALADGWEIVQPIFARPLWSSVNDTEMGFNFVIQREKRMRMIIVPQDKTVERFIRERGLAVDKP